MIRFAQPLAFLLLLFVFPMIPLLYAGRGRRTPRMLFSSKRGVPTDGASLRMLLRPLPLVLSLMAFVLLVVALARPQSATSERSRITEGIDIMLVIDVSDSMRALDFDPNRLEKAKQVVKEFIAGRTDDRVGLVIFGQQTFTLCPLTHDYTAVEDFVDRIDFDLVNGEGTAIGMGLANAVNKLKDSIARSKVVILLTDGENNFGEIQPLTAAEIAHQLKVRVYTIGIGSQGDVRMPVQTEAGWRISIQPSFLDAETLTRIANMTGGRFFMATDGDKLEQIYREIDQLERTPVEVAESNYFDELAHWFVLPALALLALAFILEETWLLSFP